MDGTGKFNLKFPPIGLGISIVGKFTVILYFTANVCFVFFRNSIAYHI